MAKARKAVENEAETEVPNTAAKKVSPKAKRAADPVEPTKAKAKAKSKAKPADDDDGDEGGEVVTLRELCEERDINPRDARIRLRRDMEREEGARWEWPADSDEVGTVIGILDAMIEKREARAAKEEPEAPAPKAKAKGKAKSKAKSKAQDDEDDEDEDD